MRYISAQNVHNLKGVYTLDAVLKGRPTHQCSTDHISTEWAKLRLIFDIKASWDFGWVRRSGYALMRSWYSMGLFKTSFSLFSINAIKKAKAISLKKIRCNITFILEV